MLKFSSLNSFSIESWNSCGWNDEIEASNLSRSSNPDILAISEMHLKDSSAVLDGSSLLTSGGDPLDPAAGGVGLLLSPRALTAIIFANEISLRILVARFKASQANLTVIVTYIPVCGRTEEQAATYEELDKVFAAVPPHDCVVVLGDLNSRLARSEEYNGFKDKEFVGRWSIHRKDGGRVLRGLMLRHDLCSISTMFQERKSCPSSNPKKLAKRRSNASWVPRPVMIGAEPSMQKKTQIDHILVCNRWKSWVKSCYTDWRLSALRWGTPQDHGSICANFKTSTVRSIRSRKKFVVSRLKDEECSEKVQNRLRSRLIAEDVHGCWLKLDRVYVPPRGQIPQEDVNGRWLRLKHAIQDTAAETLKPECNPLQKKSYIAFFVAYYSTMRAAPLSLINRFVCTYVLV